MNGLLFLLSLLLLLPLFAFALFGAFIDSLIAFGFWAVAKMLFAPLWDPFGRGLWLLGAVAGIGLLTGAGLYEPTRQTASVTLCALAIAAAVYCFRTYPGPWEPAHVMMLLPIALPAYLAKS